MKQQIHYYSTEETPEISLEVDQGGGSKWLSICFGDEIDVTFFGDREKVLADLKHAVRMAEVALLGDEPAAPEVAS